MQLAATIDGTHYVRVAKLFVCRCEAEQRAVKQTCADLSAKLGGMYLGEEGIEVQRGTHLWEQGYCIFLVPVIRLASFHAAWDELHQ